MTDYTELVKKLRDLHRDPRPASAVWLFDNQIALYDAADAIDDLQARLGEAENSVERWKDMYLTKHEPKRGEWVGVSPTVDTVQCSICGGQLFSSELETPYCPYCGAKMNDSNASNALNALDNAHDGLNNAHDGLIVRCRECRYRITSHGISDGWVLCSKPYTERGNAMHRDDWFCADGERKVQG